MKNIWKKVVEGNEKIAVTATLAMSTMWCVYLFFIWSVLPLAVPEMETICMYVSSTVIQLAALPLIMVGQSVLSRKSERRAMQDHKILKEQYEDIRNLLKKEKLDAIEMAKISANQEKIIQMLESMTGADFKKEVAPIS